MTALALDTDQAKTLAVVVIIALVVLAVVVNAIITAILGRVVVIVVALVLAAVVWSQRSDIQAAAKKCDASFFGVHLTPSNETLKRHCQRVAN